MIRTEALVVTCFDYRLQPHLDAWIQANLGYGNYNRVALAGSVKNWDVIFTQVQLSRQFHNISKVVLINHEDCRAYGEEGTPERHTHDLRAARERILAAFPDMQVELVYLHLDGQAEEVQ